MDVKWLSDFMTVAETGNFTRAAESRNASQAAFSRRIQALEAWLGTTLFDRAVFPTRLTPKGERFREYAGDILRNIEDARSELAGELKADHVRIAVPYALATSSLPDWWREWSSGISLTCSVVVGNIHDMMTALASGSVDMLICFQTEQRPFQLETNRYEHRVLRTERIRPYASQACIDAGHADLPGRHDCPVPLLMYSPGVYFSRLVEAVIETAPRKLIGRPIFESAMSDVLREMALRDLGVAWLPESTASVAGGRLLPLDGPWSTSISTVAIRNRNNDRPSALRLWTGLMVEGEHV